MSKSNEFQWDKLAADGAVKWLISLLVAKIPFLKFFTPLLDGIARLAIRYALPHIKKLALWVKGKCVDAWYWIKQKFSTETQGQPSPV